MSKTGFFIVLIAASIIVRAFYFYAQPDLSTDHLSQMAMAQNFMDGKGFSFKYLNAQGEIYYTTHIQWPPLYPFVLSIITYFTSNTLLSSFIIQISVLILLVITWRKTFNLFSSFLLQEAYYYFISFLLISTSILNNINTILVFALLLLSVSLYYTFAYLFKERSKLNLALSALFSALLFWTHYSYFFVAFYPALVMLIIYFLKKDRKYFFAGSGSFIISLVISSGVLIYNFVTTSNINYMDNPDIWDAGFFPEHLLLIDPFFLNAFFKTEYLYTYLIKENQQALISIFFLVVSLSIFILIIVIFFRLRKSKNFEFNKTSHLFVPFILIMTLTLLFLLYFTLRYHEIPRPGWTHIGDPRYMSAVYLSILAIVVLLLFIKAEYLNRKIIKAIKSILIFLIFINLFINIYITYKEWGNYSFLTNTYKVPEQELQDLYENTKIELSKGNQPVFIDNELTVRSFRICQYAGAAVINAKKVTNINAFSSNIAFFFIMPVKKQLRIEDKLLLDWSEKFNTTKAGLVYNNLTLYKVEN